MKTISILPPHEAQKIAAGEVVERPASVVKELLENALDAGATTLSLYLDEAGKKGIRLVDNGKGMSADDALLCFEPYATSKITRVEDLLSISSFGFRGEALAAIAAVSHVTLRTNQASNAHGMGLECIIEEGKCVSYKEIICPIGCDFIINDLFYNVPARKKFLKQDETEWNQIYHLVQAVCMSNIHLTCTLYRDDKRVLHAPAVPALSDRIAQLFGHHCAENMIIIPFGDTQTAISITGALSQHHYWRYNKSGTFFFVNNRLVKNTDLLRALFKGYGNSIPIGKFPVACIFISVDPKTVDINVHPRKEEVLFAKPFIITGALEQTIKKTLEEHLKSKLQPLPSTPSGFSGEVASHLIASSPFMAPFHTMQSNYSSPLSNTGNYPLPPFYQPQATVEPSSQAASIGVQPDVKNSSFFQSQLSILGQFLNTYIIFEHNEELIIIDQHAAHERILYEEWAHKFEDRAGTRLLFPEIISLPNAPLHALLKEQDFFASLGIEFEEIGPEQIALKAAPPKIHNQSLSEFLRECASFITEHEHLEKQIFKKQLTEHVHSHMACKAAVKAGDALSLEEMKSLIEKLATCNNRFMCVHGRPTTWVITKSECEKKFRRKQ